MVTSSPAPFLPPEILAQVFQPLPQPTLQACTLTSRTWYDAAIPFLYAYPKIIGKNFDSFVAAVCPSINSHVKRNGLAELVKTLDMSNLVHNGRKSLTARLLGRLKGNLEVFIAPQATFGVNCLAALSHCDHLHTLNLSLLSEAIPYGALFHSVSRIDTLHTLHLPSAYVNDEISRPIHPPAKTSNGSIIDSARTIVIAGGQYDSSSSLADRYNYPESLYSLCISGSLTNEALLRLSAPPQTLTALHISNTTNLMAWPLHIFLCVPSVSQTLQTLTIGPFKRFCSRTRYMEIIQAGTRIEGTKRFFPLVLPSLPSLNKLTADADALLWEWMIPGEWTTQSHFFFRETWTNTMLTHQIIMGGGLLTQESEHEGREGMVSARFSELRSASMNPRYPHLHTLNIAVAKPDGVESLTPSFNPQDIENAMDGDRIPSLRRLSIASGVKNLWTLASSDDQQQRRQRAQEITYLHELLQALAREDMETGRGVMDEEAAGIKYS